MDLHDKKQPYDEHDDLEEELLEEETDDILDDEEYQEDDEEAEEESAVKDDGASQPKKQKNLGVYLAMALCLVALGVGAWATYDTVVKISDVTQDTASSSAPQSSAAEVNQTVSGVPKDNVMEDNLPIAESRSLPNLLPVKRLFPARLHPNSRWKAKCRNIIIIPWPDKKY